MSAPREVVVEARGGAALLAALGIRRVVDAFALEGVRVNADRRSTILRCETDAGAVYVKRFRYDGFWRVAARLGRRSHPRREFANLELLLGLGVRAAEPLAYGEARAWGCPRAAFLVTREVAGARPLDELLAARALDPADRRRLADDVARSVARMHAAGYVDRDLKFRNILVRATAEGPVGVFVDSPLGRTHRPWSAALRRGVVHDLACLDKRAEEGFDAGDRLRFAARYGRARGLGSGELRDLLARVAGRKAELWRRTREREARRRREAGRIT